MKLEIDRTELVNALALASKAVADRGGNVILASLYLKTTNDKLQIVGTNGEQMMIVEVDAIVDREGAVAVPAKLMFELCSVLPTNSLFPVSIESEDCKMVIALDKSKYEINTSRAEGYPPVPDLAGLEMAEIKGSILALAMKQAGTASAGKDEMNATQRSVYLDMIESTTVVATDSKRMMVVDLSEFEAPANMKQGLIVPSKAVKELSEILKHADVAEMAMFKEQLVCRVEHVTYITRTLDGKYPLYQRVLPKEGTSSVIVSRKELAQALKSLLPIAKNCNNLVAYEFDGETITLIATSPENGKAETKVDCNITGEPPKIVLNLQYVADFLGCVDCDTVKIELTASNYPALFSANDGNQKCAIMPCTF
jgi:DNA polymerase-3 subunit beta